MKLLLRALSAEMLKMKRTLALWMILIAPMVIIGLVFLLAYQNGRPRAGTPWPDFSRSILSFWSFLMLPLYITLETALLAGLEHGEKQWKHLFALPVPRWTIYLAKLLMMIAFTFASMVVLWAGTIAAGVALRWVRPDLGFHETIPWLESLKYAMLIAVASLLIVSLHTWISLRWRSFTIAVGVGMSATVIGFIIMQSARWGKYYPWSLPMQIVAGDGQNLPLALILGITGGLVIGILGCWDMTRRDVL